MRAYSDEKIEYEDINDKAKKNAKLIAKFLFENFKGDIVTKASLRARFNLRHNMSIMTWEFLKEFGIEVDHTTIIIPMVPTSEPA